MTPLGLIPAFFPVLIGLFLSFLCVSQEMKSGGFVELNASAIHYNSRGNRQSVNPGFGADFGIDLGRVVSVELNYMNAWINETLRDGNKNYSYVVHYQQFAHWGGLRFCFGKAQPTYSVKGLIGVSGGNPGLSIDAGIRFIKPLNEKFAIHSAMVGCFYPVVHGDDGYYDKPLTTRGILSFRIGIGYHFGVAPQPLTH